MGSVAIGLWLSPIAGRRAYSLFVQVTIIAVITDRPPDLAGCSFPAETICALKPEDIRDGEIDNEQIDNVWDIECPVGCRHLAVRLRYVSRRGLHGATSLKCP